MKKEIDDILKVDSEREETKKMLNSVGMEAFVFIYEQMRKNEDITIEELASMNEKYANYRQACKSRRYVTTKKIIEKGKEKDVLKMIISSKADEVVKEKAEELLKGI